MRKSRMNKAKEITVSYYTENTAGGYDLINAANYVIKEEIFFLVLRLLISFD